MNQNYLKLKGDYFLKLILLVFLAISFTKSVNAQVTISGGTAATGSYTTLAAAITALNSGGALTAPVTVDVVAGHTENLTAKIVLTMTGDATNTITIQKSGAGVNPQLIAYTGTVATPSSIADGFFALLGCDYVTIDGIDLAEKATNTTTSTVMEFGYGLFKLSATDGAQYNTIKNCKITLNRIQNTSWTSPGHNGSIGIVVLNALGTATGTLTPTAASGSNSFNSFYSNTIQNCNAGFSFNGFSVAAAPFTYTSGGFGDTGNDVGGSSALTGNTILNFGGGAATNPATGLFAAAQWDMNCSYNTVNNNNGSGVNHTTTLRGFFFNSGTSPNASLTCNYNNLTIKGGGTTTQISCIENSFGTANVGTISLIGNTITGSYLTATSGIFYGIYNTGIPATLDIRNNTISNITYSASALAGSGLLYPIFNSGAATTVNINNNIVRNIARTGTTGTTTIGIYCSAGVTQNIIKNTVKNLSIDGTGTVSTMYGIQATGTTVVIDSNTVDSIRCIKTTGSSVLYGIYDISSPNNENYNYNTISNIIHRGTGTTYGLFTNTTTGTRTISFNNIFNIESGGLTVSGIMQNSSSPKIFNNKIYNITSNSTGSPIVSGLTIGTLAAAGTALVYNNYIGKINAPSALTSTPATLPTVRGLNLATTTTAVNLNVYFNTILIDGTSSGTNFGTTGIFHTDATATLDLRNNVVVNTSVPKGTGKATVYHRSAATSLATLAATSNNNLFYAGTPSASNVIYYDGTNTDQTLGAYQIRVTPREDKSASENVNFLNTTTPASANYLHINTTTPTFIEGGGVDIAGITTDFDGDTRTSPPDLGADEGVFTGLVAVAINSVSITPTGNLCTNALRTVSAVTTAGTANISSVTLKYSVNGVAQTPIAMTGGTVSGNSTWTATIPTVTPSDALVTWTVEAIDVAATKVAAGTAYKDEPLTTLMPTATATPAAVCLGSNTTLSLNTLSTPSTIGVGATTSATYSNPFYSLWSNLHEQFLIKGSELSAAGFYAGDITSLGIDISVIGTLPMIDFSLKIGHTSATDMTAFVASPTQTVFTSASLMPVLGLNNMTFSTPFAWDGVSNVVVEFCHGNPSSTATMSRTALMDNTSFVSAIKTHSTTATSGSVICGNTTLNVLTYSVRPKFTIAGNKNPFTTVEWKNGGTVVGTTATISTPVTANTTYDVVGTDLNGCTVTRNVSVTTLPLPASPTATNSTQCGSSIPTASLVSNAGANGTGMFNWYDAPSVGLLVQAPPYGALQNYYNNDFTSTVLTNSSLAGSASITASGELQLHPNSASQNGGFTVNASGYNSTQFQIDFDVATSGIAGSTADGFSYSFGNDVSAASTNPTAEQGTGSKLRISFDSYGNQGIYLMYNMTATTLTSTTPGVIAYSSNVAWVNASTVHVTININDLGQLTMSVGGVAVFTNVQLPTAYLSENKSNWAHVFKGRTGTLFMQTLIDNLVIQNNQQVAGSTTYLSLLGTTTTFHVKEIGTNGCESTATPITVTVNTPPVLTITPSQSVCNAEILQMDITSPLANYTSYTWGTGANLFTDAAATSAYVAGTNTSTVYFKSSVAGANTINVSSANSTSLCQNITSSDVTVLPNTISIIASKSVFCTSGDPVLTANANPLGSILQWQQSINGGTSWTDISGANAQTYNASIVVTTDFRLAVKKNATSDCYYSNTLTISVYDPQLLTTSGATRCGTGPLTLSATASPNATVSWYANASGGAPIATGNSFNIPTISSSTTYYAVAGEGNTTANLGLPNRVGATSNSGYNDIGLMFDAIQPFTLKSVAIYPIATTPNGNASVTIALKNSAGTTLQTQTVSVPTTVLPGVKNTVQLDFLVPAGTGHRLVVTAATGGGITGLIREVTTGYTYPYTINGLASITSAYTSGASASYYYYFYDWIITTGCESARVAVDATVTPAPAFSITTNNTICNDIVHPLTVTSNVADYNSYIWSPVTDLYTDAAGTIPYTGTSATTVYFRSTVEGVKVITANASNTTSLCTEVSAVTITVLPLPNATVQAGVCQSGSTSINLTPIGGYGAATVEWYTSPDGISFTQIPGVTTQSYTTPILTDTTYFEVVVIDGAGNSCPGVASLEVDVYKPLILSTTPGTRCGAGTVDLAAVSSTNATVRWFDTSTGGTPLSTNNLFTTPSITTTTDFFVEAIEGGSFGNTGKATANTTATSGAGTTNYGIVFDALSTFTLKSVKIYPVSATSAAGTVTIDVINSTGAVVQTKTVNVTGSPTGTFIPTVVNLDFIIPAGTNYKMRPGFTGITGLLFEPAASAPGGNYGYPYVVPGILSINTSTLTAAPTNTVRNDLYYYFYDWVVTTGCASPRTVVTATVTPAPAISASADVTICSNSSGETLNVSSSNAGYTYTWGPLTGLSTITGNSAIANPTSNTTYYITATDLSTGCNNLDTINVSVNQVPSSLTAVSIPAEVCYTGNVTLSLTSNITPTGVTYQWFNSIDGVAFSPISGATSATYPATVTATSGLYYRCEISCNGNLAITSTPVQVIRNEPSVISRTDGANCGAGTVALAAAASSGSNILWYTAATGGASVATGNTYTTPNISNTTTYYVSASNGAGGLTSVGPATMTGTTAVVASYYVNFSVLAPTTISSVNCYFNTVGTSFVLIIRDASTLATVFTYSGVTTVSGTTTTQTLPINAVLPPGNYQMGWSTNPGTYRQSTGGAYPYTIPGVLSITGNSFNDNNFYYYFYDWKVITGCESPRLPIVATIDAPAVGGTTSSDVTVCSNNNAGTLSLSGSTGNITRWESSSDIAFTTPVTIANTTTSLAFTNLAATTFYRAVVKSGSCNEVYSSITKVTVNPCVTQINAKVFLANWNSSTNLMDSYYPITPGTGFPLSDPYSSPSFSGSFTHVPSGQAVATTTASVLTATGNNAIVDWVFVELRTGASGATTVEYTKSALLQADGDIVDTDGISPLSIPLAPNGNYYVAIRHRNNLGFRTDGLVALSSNTAPLNFTNNSIVLYGVSPLTNPTGSSTVFVMNSGDANSDGSIDSVDSGIWEVQNGNYDDYFLNSDYNIDGSIDGVDSAIWEVNNGKYEELQ